MRRLLTSLLLIAFAAPTLAGERTPIGATGYSLVPPEGWEETDGDREADVLLDIEGGDSDGSVQVIRGPAGATGQDLVSAFETRMRKDLREFRVLEQERVRVSGAGAQLRTYEARRGEEAVRVLALVFIKGPTRLVLIGQGPEEMTKSLRECLLSLAQTGPVNVEEPVPGNTPEPDEVSPPDDSPDVPGTVDPPIASPARWLRIGRSGLSIRVPAGWTGGPHAATKGTRIFDPKRNCILDIAVLRAPDGGSQAGTVDQAADEFEEQLRKQTAGWVRAENRRERVGGKMARYRRYAGKPGGVSCEFHLLVLRAGRDVLLMKAIHPTHMRPLYREPVLSSMRSVRRR